MSNYIISNGELYHYGVPGMKWGVRKAQIRDTYKAAKRRGDANAKEDYKKAKASLKAEKKRFKIDQKIERNELYRQAALGRAKAADLIAKAQYKDGSRILQRTLDKNKRNREDNDTIYKYQTAKLKVKKDPKYKQSKEYQSLADSAKSIQRERAGKAFVTSMTGIPIDW